MKAKINDLRWWAGFFFFYSALMFYFQMLEVDNPDSKLWLGDWLFPIFVGSSLLHIWRVLKILDAKIESKR